MTRDDINPILEEWLHETGFYLIEAEVLSGNRIVVFIDGDEGVTIADCVKLSRFVEKRLDRETEDFEISVSSAGMDRPLKHPRQFTKALGKLVEISLIDGKKLEGILKETSQDAYVIELKPKKTNKKKLTENEPLLQIIPTTEVKDVKRAVTFS